MVPIKRYVLSSERWPEVPSCMAQVILKQREKYNLKNDLGLNLRFLTKSSFTRYSNLVKFAQRQSYERIENE